MLPGMIRVLGSALLLLSTLWIGAMPTHGQGRSDAGEVLDEARRLFQEGKKGEAMALVPDALVDAVSLLGPRERIAERIEAWKRSPVTDLLIGTNQPEAIRVLAELCL